ncbi:MAG TPA: helix-turn-helix domain-containing protein [Mycobacteriales bacterium]|nr:helix-turn-helix domain-containing protein [Mycobacteriales bacterium]
MLRDVAVLAFQGVAAFELGIACEVFGVDRSASGLPVYDFAVVAAEEPPVATTSGFTIDTAYRLDRLGTADLVVVPPRARTDEDLPPGLVDALRATVERGARVMSVCTGAFVLAAAGLLDGRRATTHWMYVEQLASRYPLIRLDRDVLYVADGPVLTSAGTAAGIDLCLHVVREEHGARVANTLARRMVVPPHRDGGQAQYVETPLPPPRAVAGLADLLAWVVEHLDEEHTVESLAARVFLAPRTFARRFRAETGTTPHHWLTGQRILLAQRLLEEGDDPVDVVAERTGFGSAANLRHHFTRWVGVAPHAYRRTFRRVAS